MLFNSAIFLVFFLAVFLLYWFVLKKKRLWLLLISGCVFYGCWDWRFLILLFFTSGVDFISAKKIHKEIDAAKAKRWLILSILINLLVLGFFKYYNFFAESFTEFLSVFRLRPSFTTIKIVLPVGISFYTFQAIAYVTDVYRKKVAAEYSALHYFSFICFFPQMVAGPIERAKKLLPQFRKEKEWSRHYFESGINLVLYGFFQKIVIADNLALMVDEIHAQPHNYSSVTLLLGIFAFAVQIYSDFCGYSNIARGTAQLLGFKLVKNFYFPYFSDSLKQFWERWHISLSTWFRDYVYIPLGGSRTSKTKRNINLLLTFLVSGLWHGANITFIAWGFFHGLAQIIEKQFKQIKLPRLISTLFVFGLVSLLFTMFRSPGIYHFFNYIKEIFQSQHSFSFSIMNAFEGSSYFLLPLVIFVLMEISKYRRKSLAVYRYNYLTNSLAILMILLFSVFENAPKFIYFQF